MQAGGLGFDAALPAGLAQQAREPGLREAGRVRRGGRGGQDRARFRPGEAAAGTAEGGQEAGEVLAQVRAELVLRVHAFPDRVLLGAREDRDGLGELAVGGQRPVRVQVGAQHIRQHG